jgi:membrane protein DedA with SNARE-associated domain
VVDRAVWVYLGFFGALLAAGLGFPIPEELPIVSAGALIGHVSEDPKQYDWVPEATAAFDATPGMPLPALGLYRASQVQPPPPSPEGVPLRWYIMLPVLICGVVISDTFLYGLGRFWGPRVLETRWCKRFISADRRRRIEENFHKYGVLVLLFARLTPTIRGPIFIMAGVMRVPFTRFVVADGIYALPGVSLLFWLSFWLGDQFRDLVVRFEHRVDAAKPILIILGLAAVAAYLIFHFLRHPMATGDPREELPVIGGQVADKLASSEAPPPDLRQDGWQAPDAPAPARVSTSDRQESTTVPHSPDSANKA